MAGQQLTVKQERLARALADPNVKTLTEAAERAGMTRTHASHIRQNRTLTTRVEVLEERQADRASRLSAKAAAVIERALDDPDCRPEVAVAAYKTAEDVKRDSGVVEDSNPTRDETRHNALFALQALELGARRRRRLLSVIETMRASLLGDDPTTQRILGLKTVRDLLRYVQGE